jgi:hypothetical protein
VLSRRAWVVRCVMASISASACASAGQWVAGLVACE